MKISSSPYLFSCALTGWLLFSQLPPTHAASQNPAPEESAPVDSQEQEPRSKKKKSHLSRYIEKIKRVLIAPISKKSNAVQQRTRLKALPKKTVIALRGERQLLAILRRQYGYPTQKSISQRFDKSCTPESLGYMFTNPLTRHFLADVGLRLVVQRKSREPTLKKLDVIRGLCPSIHGDLVATEKGVWQLFPPFKQLGVIWGSWPRIIGDVVVTTEGVWQIKPFKKLGVIISTTCLDRPYVYGDFVVTQKGVWQIRPVFKSISLITGDYPVISGDLVVTSEGVWQLRPFVKKLDVIMSPTYHIIGGLIATSQGVWQCNPFKKLGNITGKYPVISGDLVVTSEGVWQLHPFKLLGEIWGSWPEVSGHLVVTSRGVWQIDPFKQLGVIWGASPKVSGDFVVTQEGVWQIHPFKQLGVISSVEGFDALYVHDNFVATKLGVWQIRPFFKKLEAITGRGTTMRGDLVATVKGVWQVCPFVKQLGKIWGDSPSIHGDLVATTQGLWQVRPSFKKLGTIWGRYSTLKGDLLATTRGIWQIRRHIADPTKPTAPYLSWRQTFLILGWLLEGRPLHSDLPPDNDIAYYWYEVYDTPDVKARVANGQSRAWTYQAKKKNRLTHLCQGDGFKPEDFTPWAHEDAIKDAKGTVYNRLNFPHVLKAMICCRYLGENFGEANPASIRLMS